MTDRDHTAIAGNSLGGKDDPYDEGTYIIEAALNRNQIPHTFYVMEGKHQNTVWQNALYNFLQYIFVE